MAIHNKNIIDLIGLDNVSGDVKLTISDHLIWDDSNNHLQILQDKLNTYLRFIESGEIYSSYPKAKGKKITIVVACKYEPSKNAIIFLQKAKLIVKDLGIELKFNLLKT